jgi:tetratricopeptide (TPR) repeat protein
MEKSLAVETIKERLSITDSEFHNMSNIGVMFYKLGKLRDAQIIFEGLVDLDPQNSESHLALGVVYTRLQKYEEAMFHLNQSLEIDSQQVASYVSRAEVYLLQKKADEQNNINFAIADLNRAIEIGSTEHEDIINYSQLLKRAVYEYYSVWVV